MTDGSNHSCTHEACAELFHKEILILLLHINLMKVFSSTLNKFSLGMSLEIFPIRNLCKSVPRIAERTFLALRPKLSSVTTA